MVVDTLELLALDFEAFAKGMMAVTDGGNGLDERTACLTLLAGRLTSALDEYRQPSGHCMLIEVALMETQAVQNQVAWLERHAAAGDAREVIRRLTLAANQGWTAIEILQRARA